MCRVIRAPGKLLLAFVDARLVFGMHRDQAVAVAEDAVEVRAVVDQQRTGTGTHEYLDTTDRVYGIKFLQVFRRSADKEAVIGDALFRGQFEFFIQRGLVGCRRTGIRHFQETGDATTDRGARSGAEIFLVFIARFTEMHLRIDYAGHHQFTAGIHHGVGARCDRGIDALDQPVLDQQVGLNGATIDLCDARVGD